MENSSFVNCGWCWFLPPRLLDYMTPGDRKMERAGGRGEEGVFRHLVTILSWTSSGCTSLDSTNWMWKIQSAVESADVKLAAMEGQACYTILCKELERLCILLSARGEWGPGTSLLPRNFPASLGRYWGMTVILKCSHRGRVHKKQAQSENRGLQSCGNCSFSFDPLCDFGRSRQVWLHFTDSPWLSTFPLCVQL